MTTTPENSPTRAASAEDPSPLVALRAAVAITRAPCVLTRAEVPEAFAATAQLVAHVEAHATSLEPDAMERGLIRRYGEQARNALRGLARITAQHTAPIAAPGKVAIEAVPTPPTRT